MQRRYPGTPPTAAVAAPAPVNRPAWMIGLIVAASLMAGFLWAHFATARDLYRIWDYSADYSVGQLVLPTALYLAWRRRAAIRAKFSGPCWWGLGFILAAQALRFYGLLLMYESVERLAMLLTFVGVVLTIVGWRVFWELRWILAFLFLMLPLPARVHNLISGPLQEWATAGAVFLLELVGVTADRQGYVVLLNDSVPLAVAEACSGLRMLTAFMVVASAMALLIRRPGWQKATLVCSSLPIAVLCNLLRLLATALLFMVAGSATASTFFHDFAGVSMMPAAVLILIGELWLMERLVAPQAPYAGRAVRKKGG